MRHLISITVLLAVFFCVGSGSVRHVFARSLFIVAANEIKILSEEESQAKAMAERRYNNFMKTYNEIWSLFGAIHDNFTGTSGDPRFARLNGYWQSCETNKRHVYKMEADIVKIRAGQMPKTPAEPYLPPRIVTLNPAAYGLMRRNNWNNITSLNFDWLKQKAQEVTTNAEAAKQAMEQACAARDRTKADSMAAQSKEAATAAVKNYKYMSAHWPSIKEKRDEYRDLREDLLFMENWAREFRNTYQKIEEAKAALLKELGDSQGIFRYFETKKNRFSDLQRTLNTHYKQFDVITKPYKDKPWAKIFLGNMQEAVERVNTISTRIPDDLQVSNSQYNRGRLPIASAYDQFIDVSKNLDTFFSIVDEIQKLGQETKGAAKAALNNAKKAKACADNLPTLPSNSSEDHECPASWNRCGGTCCPPDVPCWDYGAIKSAVKAGRCR